MNDKIDFLTNTMNSAIELNMLMDAIKEVLSYDYSDLEESQYYSDAINAITKLEEVYNAIKTK